MKSLALFILIFSIQIGKCITFQNTHLSNYDVEHRWPEIELLISSDADPNVLTLDGVVLCQEAMSRLMAESPFKHSLTVLNILETNLNEKMLQTIFLSRKFLTLTQLALNSCSLEDQDFQFIQFSNFSEINLQKLSLQSNFISTRGFKSISLLSMPKLEHLNLFCTSLVDDQAVDSIISFGLAHLQYLDVSETSILGRNLLRIIKATADNKDKISTLRVLKINSNNFENSFYEQLTRCVKFQNLQQLSMNELLLGDDDLKSMQSWSLPALKLLNVSQNHMTDAGATKWINFQNMPLLSSLDISNNDLKEQFFIHLNKWKSESKLRLKHFSYNSKLINSKQFQEIVKMDFTSLELLSLKSENARPAQIEQLLAKNTFQFLQVLKLKDLKNQGNIFQSITKSNRKWPSLKILQLGSLGYVDDQSIESIGIDTFPSLQQLEFDVKDVSTMVKILNRISATCSKIKKVAARIWEYNNEVLGQLIDQQLKVDYEYELTIFTKEIFQFFLNLDFFHIVLKMKKTGQPELLNIDMFQTIAAFNEIVEEDYVKIYERSLTFPKQFLTHFKIDKITYLTDFGNLSYFKTISEGSSPCIFHELRSAFLLNVTDEGWRQFISCEYPTLTKLKVVFNVSEETLINISSQFPKNKFVNIQYLAIEGGANTDHNYKILRAFFETPFENLQQLNITGCMLKSEQLISLFGIEEKFSRIRYLELSNNLLSSNVQFLSKFTLRQLELRGVIFGNVFPRLCHLNYQFLTLLNFYACGITNEQMKKWANCISSLNRSQPFPKLKNFILPFNEIGTSGFQQLFSLQFSMLASVLVVGNRDPQVFNTFFKSLNSRRNRYFDLYHNYVESIDPNLDPRSTEQLTNFVLYSTTLRPADFKTLSDLDFRHLKKVFMDISLIEQCGTLGHILKIIQHADQIVFNFDEIKDNLSSNCLTEWSDEQSQEIVLSRVEFWISSEYGNTQKFIGKLLNANQQFQSLILIRTFVANQKIKQMTEMSAFAQIQTLILSFNELSDQSLQALLGSPMDQIQKLAITRNSKMTGSALSLMQNRTYSKLRHLDLSQNIMGDLGVAFLIANQFPRLMELILRNIQLSGTGLQTLNSLQAPKLSSLDISCNELSIDQILKFNSANFPSLKTIVLYPTLKEEQFEILSRKFAGVDITTDLEYQAAV